MFAFPSPWLLRLYFLFLGTSSLVGRLKEHTLFTNMFNRRPKYCQIHTKRWLHQEFANSQWREFKHRYQYCDRAEGIFWVCECRDLSSFAEHGTYATGKDILRPILIYSKTIHRIQNSTLKLKDTFFVFVSKHWWLLNNSSWSKRLYAHSQKFKSQYKSDQNCQILTICRNSQ